jgi:hypothetical protein
MVRSRIRRFCRHSPRPARQLEHLNTSLLPNRWAAYVLNGTCACGHPRAALWYEVPVLPLNGSQPCRDLHTGTQLAAFKGNGSGSNCMCTIGRDYVASAQMAKDSLHFWTWHKVTLQLYSCCSLTTFKSMRQIVNAFRSRIFPCCMHGPSMMAQPFGRSSEGLKPMRLYR